MISIMFVMMNSNILDNSEYNSVTLTARSRFPAVKQLCYTILYAL